MIDATNNQKEGKHGNNEKQQLAVILWRRWQVFDFLVEQVLLFIRHLLTIQDILLLELLDGPATVGTQISIIRDLSPTMLTFYHFVDS